MAETQKFNTGKYTCLKLSSFLFLKCIGFSAMSVPDCCQEVVLLKKQINKQANRKPAYFQSSYTTGV